MTESLISSPPSVLSVGQLNQSVARLLERSVPLCWIAGEVSNFTRASSGHWYFTLKDAQAQVRSVMFKSRAMGCDFIPREGEKIEVRATVTLYAPRGDYQLNVEGIRRAGQGNLYEAFLQLKQKLADLFAPHHKQALPLFPRCIGIVTSPQAAALRDILITLRRRAPHIAIIIYPTLVQGNGAALQITQALQRAVLRRECDVLIVARGGGSIEDLWAFNDEQLAHALFDCPIPLITGIGHETDFTIADFVADLRAPTPTAAAEMAVTARSDLLQQCMGAAQRLQRSLRRHLEQENQTLDGLARRLISPLAYVRNERSRLAGLQMQLQHRISSNQRHAFYRFGQLRQRLLSQSPRQSRQKNLLQQLAVKCRYKTEQRLAGQRQLLNQLSLQLELLNPQRTLERGYAIIIDQQGNVLQQVRQFQAPGQVTVRLADGEVDLGVSSIATRIN